MYKSERQSEEKENGKENGKENENGFQIPKRSNEVLSSESFFLILLYNAFKKQMLRGIHRDPLP